MFVLSYPTKDRENIFYFDAYGNKYAARGGSLAWRINNPGLVHSRSRVAKRYGSIGACEQFAIFSSAGKGHEALAAWLQQKRNARGTLKTLAKHYRPDAAEAYASQLASLTELPVALDAYRRERVEVYQAEVKKVSNVTMVEPDPGISWQHSFNSSCYQTVLRKKVKQYQGRSDDQRS